MLFRQVYFDHQVLGGRTSIPFFEEVEGNPGSITSMPEDAAINWLLGSGVIRDLFVEEFLPGARQVRWFCGTTGPFTTPGKKPGDIDLLLVDADQPQKAIAFECKRVKVTSIKGEPGKVNNAGAIAKGVAQANALQSLGFHRSYLMIVLLDDSRHEVYPNTMLRRTVSASTEEVVYDIPQNESLHDEVGVTFVQVTQSSGKHFNERAGVGICTDKAAGRLDQTPEMTTKVRSLLKHS